MKTIYEDNLWKGIAKTMCKHIGNEQAVLSGIQVSTTKLDMISEGKFPID